MGIHTVLLKMVRIKEARTFIPPWREVNFSRIVWRGIRRRSPGSASSKAISTKDIGSTGGVVETGDSFATVVGGDA